MRSSRHGFYIYCYCLLLLSDASITESLPMKETCVLLFFSFWMFAGDAVGFIDRVDFFFRGCNSPVFA